MKRRPKPVIYVLYDAHGELFGSYETQDEAETDAVGPRFRPTSTVRRYMLEDASVFKKEVTGG